MSAITDTLWLPFRGDALGVNLTFTLLFGTLFFFIGLAGPLALFGLPALLLLGPWFAKYCIVVGREASFGRSEPPALAMENLSPLELQPIGLTVGLLLLHWALSYTLGPDAAVAAIALITPAAIAVLVVEDSAIDALNPLVLARYVLGLGLAYPMLALVLAGSLWLCNLAVGSGLGTFATVFILQSVLLATFHAVGRLLQSREGAIGYTRPENATERDARQARAHAEREFEHKLSEAYHHAEAGQPEQALETVLAYVREAGDAPNIYAATLDRLLQWDDSVVALAFARHYGDRLFRRDDHGQALRILLRAYDLEPRVRPLGEEATLKMAREARASHRADAALAFVDDFEERFPESRLRPVALVERARLVFTERGDPASATDILEQVERDHPGVLEREDVRRFRDRVRAATKS